MSEHQTCRSCLLSIFTAGAILGAALPAQAGEPAGTLERIGARGAIHLGYREAAVPFSYLDEQQNVRGYTWELCGRVVEAVKARLGMPELPVVPMPVTPNNRMLAVRAGSIDLECGDTAGNPARQRQAAFAPTTYVAGVKALVRVDSPIRTLADLDGKRVVTTLGSGAERLVKTALALRGSRIEFAVGDDHAGSLALLGAGQADAFVQDDATLAVLRAGMPDPAGFRLLEDDLAVEPYAIMLGRDDPAFKQLVDETLAGLMQSGELERIYDKWFMSPIPPAGIKLQLPMSDMLRQLIRNPGDKAG
jgi:glutamate/aspartate transport system substrate-binding protein